LAWCAKFYNLALGDATVVTRADALSHAGKIAYATCARAVAWAILPVWGEGLSLHRYLRGLDFAFGAGFLDFAAVGFAVAFLAGADFAAEAAFVGAALAAPVGAPELPLAPLLYFSVGLNPAAGATACSS